MASRFHRPSRRATLVVLAAALLLQTAPAAWADQDTDSSAQSEDTAALFSEVFSDIQSYYIEQEPLSILAQTGLQALDNSGGLFSVSVNGKSVSFLHHGVLFATASQPTDDDAFGWGAVIAVGVDKAKSVVPGLTQTSADDIDATIIDGMLKRFDRFSRYSSPEPAQTQRDNRDGFGGIGVGIDQSDSLPRVTEVFPGGPAATAGIAVNDHLLAIDGKLLQGIGRDAVVDMLRGQTGTGVDISVRRAGAPIPLTFHVIRSLIVPPTVTREDVDSGIVTLRISEFNADTASSLDVALLSAKRDTPDGLRAVIIDLRGNPGGLLAKGGGVDATSLFLDRGDIVSTIGRNPASVQHFGADNHDVTGGLPLAILVNGGSASAAEVMTAALQDQGRAIVVGSASYGKGTVQEVNDLRNGAELTLTWARLFPPDGYLLHKHGVVPQFCTSRGGETVPMEITRGLRPTETLASVPRASLNDNQWMLLRQSCPPVMADNPQDLELAKKVLKAPKIYQAALFRPPTTIARRGND